MLPAQSDGRLRPRGGAAGTTGAVAVVAIVGAALKVASVGLAIASVAVGSDKVSVPGYLMDAINGLSSLKEQLGTAFDEAYNLIANGVSDAASSKKRFVDYLKDRGFVEITKAAQNY